MRMKSVLIRFIVFIGLSVTWGSGAEAVDLQLHPSGPYLEDKTATQQPGQLPGSRAVSGGHDIALAWLADATGRYRHGVLGDELEAATLAVVTATGRTLRYELPEQRVLEDLEPRIVDLDGDRRDEIIVVESDLTSGASLAVYGLRDGRLEKLAATSFLGRPNRWLNPVGAGDFDDDGRMDLALVTTPHIGGVLQLYNYRKEQLELFAAYPGISTHRIGTTALALGRVVAGQQRDRLLVPDQLRSTLLLLEFSPEGWLETSRVSLPGTLGSALYPVAPDRWQFSLEDGRHFSVRLTD